MPLFKILALLVLMVISLSTPAPCAEPINIGNRLELFVDDHLIEKTEGDILQQLLKPEPKEVVIVTDKPWEGSTCLYYTIFQDGDIYRMIYRGWDHNEKKTAVHKEVTCYAESKDGVHWMKPDLGLFEWNGSKNNNIVWIQSPATHNFTAFRDDNPAAPPEARYKALGSSANRGLLALQSPDCIHWKLIQDESVLTNGAFDSQNLAFWDTELGEYRAYWRFFGIVKNTEGKQSPSRTRAIRTATSKDFLNWENETDLVYSAGSPNDHLYTNAIEKYFRAPHLFVGFPTRFITSNQQTEPIFMTSRDGKTFHRYADPVIPRTAPKDRNHNRSNYISWGMLQLPSKPNEISVYGSENYYEKTPSRLRRFVYRVDGFVALRGGKKGGQVTTKPLGYNGQQLLLNYVVRQGGSLQVEVLDDSGKVIGRSKPIHGDAVDAPVTWAQAPKLSQGTVQLRFNIKNADVFSFRFN